MEVEVAMITIEEVWGDKGMHVLRLPGSLLTEEGKRGRMLRWFLDKSNDMS